MYGSNNYKYTKDKLGGKMNLNPLKKDDHTDALVKALEDANNPEAPTGAPAPATDGSDDSGNPTDAATQVPAVPPGPGQAPAQVADDSQKLDESIIAADPQLNGDNPLLDDSKADDSKPAEDQKDDTPTGIADAPKEEPKLEKTEEKLPDGLSSDADAHLPKPHDESTGNSELDSVKKDALQALRPLIDKLDLTPSEKFDKYLMMLRASDDSTLIKPAYEAAAQIDGEKEKAQALLDVINEINYLTANK